jgi:geranylgeranyl pyrophosphate synthase
MKTLIQAHFQMIESELQAVERRLQTLLQSEIPIVNELGLYLTRAGGKRFRPALVLFFYKILSEQAASPHSHPNEDAIEQATLLELIHMATLAHDDVIDRADQRRHHASLHLEWGNRKAVYEGDFIFSRVFKVLNRYETPIRSLVIEAVEDVLEGELLQESLRWQVATEEEYYRVIQGKTASLIAAACALGARLGDTRLSSDQVNKLYEAGLHLGTAYQMVDDLLDIFGDDIGKPTWSDRNGGWLTLPFIWLLERSKPTEELLPLLQARTITEHEREYLMAQLEEKEIHQAVMIVAREQIERAKCLLQWLPDSAMKQALFSGFHYVLDRKL